jgi:hypothetical protein
MNNSGYVRYTWFILLTEVLGRLKIWLLGAFCVPIAHPQPVSAIVHTASTVRKYIYSCYIHDLHHLSIADGHQNHDA